MIVPHHAPQRIHPLRALDVTMVASNEVPFERTLDPAFGALLWQAQEKNAAASQLGHTLDRTSHFGLAVSYVGHAANWSAVVEEAGPGKCDRAIWNLDEERLLTLTTIGRDRLSLETEAEMVAA